MYFCKLSYQPNISMIWFIEFSWIIKNSYEFLRISTNFFLLALRIPFYSHQLSFTSCEFLFGSTLDNSYMNFYLGISMNPLASLFPIPIIAHDQKKDTWKSANRTLFRLLSVYIIVVALLLLSLLQACRVPRGTEGCQFTPRFMHII